MHMIRCLYRKEEGVEWCGNGILIVKKKQTKIGGQMVVAPKDLLLPSDTRHKRMSWDGGAV